MSLLQRRILMNTLRNNGLFTYVKDYIFSNTYGHINISIDVEDNSTYLLIPKNQESINTVFILANVRNGKCGFSYCNEDTNNGLSYGNNYGISNGRFIFQISATNNNIYDVEYEMYKMQGG